MPGTMDRLTVEKRLIMTAYTNPYHGKKISANGPKQIKLSKNQLYRLDSHQGPVRIENTSGSLWVTQPGDPYDYVLEAGGQISISKRGVLLLEALEDASVRIQPV
jgi:hypothetical protein